MPDKEKMNIRIMSAAGLLLDLLYPRHCAVCRRVLSDPTALVCPDCARRLSPVSGSRCMRCGKLVPPEVEYCRDCKKGRHFKEGVGIFHYEGEMKKSILAFKYGGHCEYALFYAWAIMTYAGDRIRAFHPDLLVPVPMYPGKIRRRGYNQAALIARELSKLTGIACEENLVVKVRPTASQKTLDAAARRNNLSGALSVRGTAAGLKILVVDDVFTTGGTVDAVAGHLLRAGALEVMFAAVCTGRQE